MMERGRHRGQEGEVLDKGVGRRGDKGGERDNRCGRRGEEEGSRKGDEG